MCPLQEPTASLGSVEPSSKALCADLPSRDLVRAAITGSSEASPKDKRSQGSCHGQSPWQHYSESLWGNLTVLTH